ncbi:hypothetical protein BDA96_05G197000 [Sorghum bicolor]|uniref:Uncharacterized protein n=1 Tax=Sorghum bicolor TaxID=4558 RepID=A0A921UGC2_SORBI|nr:hypothetical protein BDA96_05G197000 [Sorghum bicolor]
MTGGEGSLSRGAAKSAAATATGPVEEVRHQEEGGEGSGRPPATVEEVTRVIQMRVRVKTKTQKRMNCTRGCK